MSETTASQILATLITSNGDSCPLWIAQAAAYINLPAYGSGIYETTAVNFFPEVTVRLPMEGTTRRGKPRLQRRRIDLAALVQAHYRNFEPIAIGVEIKVSAADLLADNKLIDYLPYVHLFYLAVPPALEDDALNKLADIPWSPVPEAANFGPIGLLIVGDNHVTIRHHPDLVKLEKRAQSDSAHPTDAHLKELYAELLLRPFKRAKKTRRTFNQFQ
jgi:hypothetical protein